MRIFPLCCLTVLLSSVAFSQNSNVMTVDEKPDLANSTIKARVYYEDSGRPVKRTSVILISNGAGAREATGTTDGNGYLEIKNVRAGKYYAIVNAPGAVSPMAYLDFRQPRQDSFDEQLAPFPAITVNGISDTETQIPVRRGGAISGRIVYADGDIAIGVKVEILRKVDDEFLPTIPNLSVIASSMSGGVGTLQTDDRGYFRFAGLPAGEYIVKVTEKISHTTNPAEGYRDSFESLLFGGASIVTTFYQEADDKSKAQILPVAFGQELPELNIVIPDRDLKTVAGKVISAKDKLPIRNAKLVLQIEGEDTSSRPMGELSKLTTYSDENGNWKFIELPKGKYKVLVEAMNHELDEKGKVYGAASSANLANAMVANAPGNGSSRNAAAVKKIVPKFGKKIQDFVVEEKEVPEVIVELATGATISGVVTSEDGKDIPSYVTIKATNENPTVFSSANIYPNYDEDDGTSTKPDGSYVIEGVSPGRTYLSVSINGSAYYLKSVMHSGSDLLKDGIDLKESESLKNVQFVLANDAGTLEGKLIDEDKQPVVGGQVSLVPTDAAKFRNESYFKIIRSDENGEFKAELPPGEYAMVAVTSTVRQRPDFIKWLTEAVKTAQKFKIEAKKSQKATFVREKKKAVPS